MPSEWKLENHVSGLFCFLGKFYSSILARNSTISCNHTFCYRRFFRNSELSEGDFFVLANRREGNPGRKVIARSPLGHGIAARTTPKTAQKAGFSLRISYKTRNFSLIHARKAVYPWETFMHTWENVMFWVTLATCKSYFPTKLVCLYPGIIPYRISMLYRIVTALAIVNRILIIVSDSTN